jgi:hypothetical protein
MMETQMANALLQHVESELVPVLRSPATVVDTMDFGQPEDGLVILRFKDLRIQITRDRGEMRVDIGPMSQPHIDFDDQVLGELLGLGTGKLLFDSKSTEGSMKAIASFLNAYGDTLASMFGPEHFAETRCQLDALREARVQRLFGPQ